MSIASATSLSMIPTTAIAWQATNCSSSKAVCKALPAAYRLNATWLINADEFAELPPSPIQPAPSFSSACSWTHRRCSDAPCS